MRLSFFLYASLFGTALALPGKKPPKPPPEVGAASDPALIAKTDHLIFNVTIEEFIQARNLGLQGATSDLLDPRFDFASDGCSSSPDHPLGFDFQPACYRHDFGYRNYHKQNRFNEPNREKLDNNLYMDLLNVCAAEEKVHRYKLCWDIAKLYFKAVRKFGDGHKAVLAEGGHGVEILAMEVQLDTVAMDLAELSERLAV